MKGSVSTATKRMPEPNHRKQAALCFEVPLPPSALSANSREDYRAIAAAKKAYGLDVRNCAIDARNRARWRAPERVEVHLVFGNAHGPVFHDGCYRPVDWPNGCYAWKAGYDALVRAGLFADDNAAVMPSGSVAIDPACGPFVQVTVVDLSEDW